MLSNAKKIMMKKVGLFLMFVALSYSSVAQNVVTEIHGKQIKVDGTSGIKDEYETFVAPYKQQINRDLDKVLANNPQLLDKTKGTELQSNIGDLFAQVVLDKSNKVLFEREKIKADISILNFGGIRAVIPAGNVTARNAFEVMPFENSAVVLEVTADVIIDYIKFFIKDKRAHPFTGLTFTITKDNKPKDIKIGGKDIEFGKKYYIATNDYLANGGDKMEFFTRATKRYVLDYKLRDMLIDYFIDVDVINVPTAIKVIKE